MKILYISYRINASDGSSVHGRAFVASVARLGHEVTTYPEIRPISPIIRGRKPATRTLWHYLRKINFRTLKYYLARTHGYVAEFIDFADGVWDSISDYLELKKRLKSCAPDVIVCRQEIFHFAPIWIAKAFHIPCLLEVNSIRSIEAPLIDTRCRISFLTRWAERWALKKCDAVFSVSEPIKAFVDAYTDAERSYVILNGVDTDEFDPRRFDSAEVKRQLGLDGKTVLGYVGSYKTWHGLDVAIDVIDLLGEIDRRYHLLLIGNGQEYPAIVNEVLRRGLSDRVTQLPYLAHGEVARHLAAFDFALMTYPDMKGFYFSPLKMFEYLSMGIPVITTNVGQIAEIIKPGETGLLVYPPTAEDFVHAVVDANGDTAGAGAMRKRCRDMAVRQHSWTENARQVLTVCQDLVDARDIRLGNTDGR
jgi:glycosyltransferase involved in cell wall biosynthesis